MENPKKITTIGGQALMEGIMMVGPKRTVAAFCDEELTLAPSMRSPASRRKLR